MKTLHNFSLLSVRIITICLISLLTIMAKAQDQGIDIDVTLDEGKGRDWYQNPIAWVVGAAVFILLLVALLRGGKKDA